MATTTQTEPTESHELSSPAPWATHTEPRGIQAPHPSEPQQPSENRSFGGLNGPTLLKVVSASFSFFVAGVNDGSVGAIIPYVIRQYNVNTAIVSSV